MRIILILLLALTSAAKLIHHHELLLEEWNAFKLRYNKTYIHRDQERVAMKIFAQNKYKIALHNQRYERGLETFRMGTNRFSDMTLKQFSRVMNGYRRTRDKDIKSATYIYPANVIAWRSVDWVKEGAVTQVKDQTLRCRSCWAFAATGALEGQHFRKDKRLVSLSEQNLIDCTQDTIADGCRGGNVVDSFTYVSYNGGIDTEETYPYEAAIKKCRYNDTNSGAADVGFVEIEEGNEDDLEMAVATIGPVAVVIDGEHTSFMQYESGVYYEKRCSSVYVNHAMLVVGYGWDDRSGAYWLVKNSYGTGWGEDGYIRMARYRKNNCGIATEASFPLV